MMSHDGNDVPAQSSWASRRGSARPKVVSSSPEDWVETSFLSADSQLPVVLRPRLKSVDLASWIQHNRALLETQLLQFGGVLFRDFGLQDQEDFARAVAATGIELMDYIEGATPRTELKEKLYTSTEFPASETIAPHNELCYVTTWPMKIFFFCVQPAQQGGETPLVDVRRVLQHLDPEILAHFTEKQWMLLRNFGDGFGPSWQHSYRRTDPAALEAYFRESEIAFEWKGGDRVRTRQVRPAVARHPKSNAPVWFNHISFWHISKLRPEVRELFRAEFADQDLPYNTYFGDGTPIADEVIAAIDNAYQECMVAFPWQAGDLLMLDNMLVAHGRKPYSGPRRILTAMGEPESRRG